MEPEKLILFRFIECKDYIAGSSPKFLETCFLDLTTIPGTIDFVIKLFLGTCATGCCLRPRKTGSWGRGRHLSLTSKGKLFFLGGLVEGEIPPHMPCSI